MRTKPPLLSLGRLILWLLCVVLFGGFLADPSHLALARSKSKPCATNLEACPSNGCAKKGTPDAFLNEGKRRVPPSGTAIFLAFDDLAQLQQIVDDLGIPQGRSSLLSRKTRKKLTSLDLGNGKIVGEGDLVEIVGFIARDRTLKPAGAESVNCRLPDPNDNDIHVPIVERQDETEYDSIVIEPIPQKRPSEWSLANLKSVQSPSRVLLVRGQLFYDNKHQVRDDPHNEEGLKSEPKRFTLCEIHPVTEILVCKKAANDCDPDKPAEWRPLG